MVRVVRKYWNVIVVEVLLLVLLPTLVWKLGLRVPRSGVPAGVPVYLNGILQLAALHWCLRLFRGYELLTRWIAANVILTVAATGGVYVLKLQAKDLFLGGLALHLAIGYCILLWGCAEIYYLDRRR